ncbi:MAG: arylsulfatase A-like enzyme [Candidatus Paceibacteria bacterium]|jgi:arylsulfatase A-like enzyme
MSSTSVRSWRLPLLLSVAILGCAEKPAEGLPEQNVLLVTLDTTRADHLGCYGKETANTPNLDMLAQEGVRFEHAYSTAGITPMSHASILTGRNNYSHGLRVFYGELGHRLPDDVPSLPEILGERGWRTAAFVSSYPVSQAYGLSRGYQHFRTGLEDSIDKLDLTKQQRHNTQWQDGRRNNTQRRADNTTDEALSWLEEHGENGPWHVWMHFFDVHDFSLVPPLAVAEQASITYDPRIGSKDVAVREQMYDFELGYVDSQIGRIVDYLKQTGQYDNTMIVVVADHGQGLSDGVENHDWLLHRLLYDWSLHVPLILKLPGHPGGLVVNELVRTVDVMPTILEHLDLAPPMGVDGRSVLPLVRGELDEPRIAYADALNLEDTHSPGSKLPGTQNDNLYVAMDLRWKLIHHHKHPENSELYDLQRDPTEQNNLFGKRPAVTDRLMRFLVDRDAFRLVPGATGGPAPDASALDDLGYTGE